jgi:hypothetical protein
MQEGKGEEGAAGGVGRGSREGNCAGRVGGGVGGRTTGWDRRLGTGRTEGGTRLAADARAWDQRRGAKRLRRRTHERTHGE